MTTTQNTTGASTDCANVTPGYWGIERTPNKLWVGPIRKDGSGKIREIVTSFDIGEDFHPFVNSRVEADARLVSAAPILLDMLKYAKHFLKGNDVDMAYIDAAIKQAEGK